MTKLIRNMRTTAGKKLINSAISGDNKLIYTTAELYAKDISNLTDSQVADTSNLGTSLLSGKINITDYNDTTITVSAEFLNANLTSDIAFKTIGWYATTAIDKAQGKPPVLFVISQLDNEATMVAGNNERTTSFFIPRIIMRISDAQSVVLETGEVGFVTLPELEGKLADLANKGLIDFGKKLNNDFNINNLHNTSLQYVDKGSVTGLPETSKDEPKDLGGYLISLGKGDTTQDGVRIYFNPFSNKTFISYYLNKTNTWTSWLEVGSKSYTKEEIDKILAGYVTKENLDGALNGKANVTDLIKYVKSIEGFKPDKETGNVTFLSDTYENQEIQPNTFTTPGVYKIINCTYKYVSIINIDGISEINGYLIVTKGNTDDDFYQYLITDINSNAQINFRKINPSKSIYPTFKKLLDNQDVHTFNSPDANYARGETFDLDKVTETGIYSFMDSRVICSMRTDALNWLPRTGDGTMMCGYLIVLKHDDFNREQILVLNSGVEIPDIAIAVRSISGTNNYRTRFRKVIKTEDLSINSREHYFTRNSVSDPSQDDIAGPIMPTDIVSNTSIYNRVNLDNLINTYEEGSRVIDDYVSNTLPLFYNSHFTLQYNDGQKDINLNEGLFNSHTQIIRYLVKPMLYSDSYDTYQRVKSGGCVFERYHQKIYSSTDESHGWLSWVFVENYNTGLGDRSLGGILNSSVNNTNKTTSYNTIGFDYPPFIPGFAPFYYFTGFYNEKAKNSWFPPGTYVRRIGSNNTVDVDLPQAGTANGGLTTSGDTILKVICTPLIWGGDTKYAVRETAHFVQTAYAISPNLLHVDTNNPDSPQFIYDYYFVRQGDVSIPINNNINDFTNYKRTVGKWNKISTVTG